MYKNLYSFLRFVLLNYYYPLSLFFSLLFLPFLLLSLSLFSRTNLYVVVSRKTLFWRVETRDVSPFSLAKAHDVAFYSRLFAIALVWVFGGAITKRNKKKK